MSEIEVLRKALAEAGEDGAEANAFCSHFSLVLKWNPTHNLTRVTRGAEAAVLHYLDCVVPLRGQPHPARFIDVGSGAGFPGLVAALLWPNAEALLVEPARKRASFLQVAAGELGLKNVKVLRPEDAPTAALVLSRATFSAGLRGSLWPYLLPGGSLLAWATSHELPMWEKEVATWDGATLQYQPYPLPTPSGGAPLAHGIAHIARAALPKPSVDNVGKG